jgi:hypothetical protein
MVPNTSALLLLLEDKETEGLVNDVQGYDANVVTMTVGDELSGEIANFASGYVTDADGNVVAAADAGEAAEAS